MAVCFNLVCFIFAVQLTLCAVHGKVVEYHLPEGDRIGREVGNVAVDAKLIDIVGEGDFANLRYNFLKTGTPHYSSFDIDNHTSLLSTKSAIDRELICEFTTECFINLNIAVQSTKSNFFKKISVKVNIDDVNDNPPVFDTPVIDLEISEAVVVGTSITIDGARDADTSDVFSLQSYEVIPNNTPFEINFEKKLDGTSVVRLIVKEALDREKRDDYQFRVIARDGGSPPLSGTLKVNITVSDVNDNVPKFTLPTYYVTVKENINISTVIKTLTATDDDNGKNGRLFYRLSPHQSKDILRLFAINNVTGELSVTGQLKYVQGEHYVIIVEASDFGDQPLTSQTLVNVTVKDAGNNPPSITLNLLSTADVAKVSEFADRGVVVAHIAVKDPDTGLNGEIICQINNAGFRLQRLENHEFKVTVDRVLDRETAEKIHVQVSCQDKGNPPLNVSTNFNVEVEDENDNSPIFEMSVYTAGITENNNRGGVIIHVKANDEDLDDNAKIQYFLNQSDLSSFTIDENSGIIRTNIVLDREVTSTYTLIVFARDYGVPSLTGSATVIISVLDQNDNEPKFNQSHYTFEVLENAYSGTEVGYLYATDRDDGENAVIVFSGPDSVPFTIFPEGIIKTDRQLDREVQNRYDFTAQAKDKDHMTNVRVTIMLKDENDNYPVVTSPSNLNNTIVIDKNTNINSLLTRIRAYDLDTGINSQLNFKIIGRNDTDRFDLHRDRGDVILKKSLSNDVGKSFKLDILVSDMGFPVRSTPTALNIKISSSIVGPQESQSNNVIIVIILVSVTIVISAGIVFVIIFIRRNDQRQKQKHANMYKNAAEVNVGVFSLPSEESISSGDKKKKKEVSFSLENGVDKQICEQSKTQNAEFTYDNDIEIVEEEIVVEFPIPAQSVPVDSTPDITRNCGSSVQFETQLNGYKPPANSKSPSPIINPDMSPRSILRNKKSDKLVSCDKPPIPPRSANKMTTSRYRPRKVEDNHSLGSASDSGRGGSDDELNLSRTHNTSGELKSTQKDWYKFQRPYNSAMQTFLPHSSAPPYSSVKTNQNPLHNFHYTDSLCQPPENQTFFHGRSMSYDTNNPGPSSVTLSRHDSYSTDCVV